MVAKTSSETENSEENSDEPEFPDTVEDVLKRRTGLRDSVDSVGAGAIVSDNNTRYWVDEDTLEREVPELPNPVRVQLDRGRGISYLRNELDGVERLGFKSRSSDFLKALDRELGADRFKLSYDPDVAEATLAGEARVPVWLATHGKYYVAAYLAAHGFSNQQIAHGLDVSESTIKVNLSKFKNGDG